MERGGELEHEVGDDIEPEPDAAQVGETRCDAVRSEGPRRDAARGDELCCGAERGDELRRLDAFEAFAASVREDLADASARMYGLRAAGKVKSATYRQLFAIRSTLREVDRRLRDYGL